MAGLDAGFEFEFEFGFGKGRENEAQRLVWIYSVYTLVAAVERVDHLQRQGVRIRWHNSGAVGMKKSRLGTLQRLSQYAIAPNRPRANRHREDQRPECWDPW